MDKITEIIPDSIPDWAKEAMDDGQFFRIAIERVKELESNPWEKLYKEAEAEIEQLRSKLNGWIRCDKELPSIGLPVIAICYDGTDHFIPRVVLRVDTDHGWAWNLVNNLMPVYAENQAHFNFWMPVTSLPEPPK